MSGEKKYYLANLPANTDLRTLAAAIKARCLRTPASSLPPRLTTRAPQILIEGRLVAVHASHLRFRFITRARHHGRVEHGLARRRLDRRGRRRRQGALRRHDNGLAVTKTRTARHKTRHTTKNRRRNLRLIRGQASLPANQRSGALSGRGESVRRCLTARQGPPPSRSTEKKVGRIFGPRRWISAVPDWR